MFTTILLIIIFLSISGVSNACDNCPTAADRIRIRSNTDVLECIAEFHSARNWDIKSVWCACMTQEIDEEFFNDNHPWNDGINDKNLPMCVICINVEEYEADIEQGLTRACCWEGYPNLQQWEELILLK